MGTKEIVSDLVRNDIISIADGNAILDKTAVIRVVATGAAVADVAGTAGGTYTATEQATINELATQLNALLAELRTTGIIAT